MIGATAIRERELAGLREHFHEDEIVEWTLVVGPRQLHKLRQ